MCVAYILSGFELWIVQINCVELVWSYNHSERGITGQLLFILFTQS